MEVLILTALVFWLCEVKEETKKQVENKYKFNRLKNDRR